MVEQRVWGLLRVLEFRVLKLEFWASRGNSSNSENGLTLAALLQADQCSRTQQGFRV